MMLEKENIQKYKHFKNGKLYEVLGEARHSETLEEMIIYRALYENQYGFGSIWVRPKGMFFEMVLHQGNKVPRFEKIEE